MNARISHFLQALDTQLDAFTRLQDNLSKIVAVDITTVSELIHAQKNLAIFLNSLQRALPALQHLAQISPDFPPLLNEANALLDWAGLNKTNSAPLLERLTALNRFFENDHTDYDAVQISRSGDITYGLGLNLHDGSLASYLAKSPVICGMDHDAFYDHFFGDPHPPLRDAVEEGQNALANFLEQRFILRFDPILSRKQLQLPDDIEGGLKRLALHPAARQMQLRQVAGKRFESTKNDAIRIGMHSLRGFAMLFDASSIRTDVDSKLLIGRSDTDKCLTLADAFLSKMHGHLASHWQNRLQTIVEGKGLFDGKLYDETSFLGPDAQIRTWQNAAFEPEITSQKNPDHQPTPVILTQNNSLSLGDRVIEPLTPMTQKQKKLFLDAIQAIPQPVLSHTRAVEMPDGWSILCNNVPLFLSERANELECARLFPNQAHSLETWIKRLAAQIRGDVLINDSSDRSLPLGSLEGQPYRRRWFKTTLARLLRDPHALPFKAIVRSRDHAVDLYDSYDHHALRLEFDDFRAIRQQPLRRLNDYNALPVVQMQVLTQLWLCDLLEIPAEIPVPPLERSVQYTISKLDNETLCHVPLGTPVYPIARGRVITCGKLPQAGNAVLIEHPAHLFSRYTNLATLNVVPNQLISADVMLGRCGAGLNGPALGISLDNSDSNVQSWNDFGRHPLELSVVLHSLWTEAPALEMLIQ